MPIKIYGGEKNVLNGLYNSVDDFIQNVRGNEIKYFWAEGEKYIEIDGIHYHMDFVYRWPQ